MLRVRPFFWFALFAAAAVVADDSRATTPGQTAPGQTGPGQAADGSPATPKPRRPKIDPRLVPLPREAPAPADNPTTPAKVELGKQLFFDPRLSGANTLSCASCHVPERAWGDGLQWNKGHNGATLTRNTPSLLNVGFYSTYFWDGRAKSLEEQALGPIVSPVEMNQGLDELEAELRAIPGYVERFQQVFGGPPSRDRVAKALAAFQRTLVTGPSPFDRYLAGEEDALSADAKRGLELFQGTARCIECHHGPNLSDGKPHRIGLSVEDFGLATVTDRPEDRFRFRTPSLRNVAETGPYSHDGTYKSVEDVVEFYYRGAPPAADDLPLDTPDLRGESFSDVAYLVAFLESLSGELPKISPPQLPQGNPRRQP
jgi:cytochrome c peroxidase